MQEDTGSQVPFNTKYLVPEIYMPRLQLMIRMILGILGGAYFYFSPIPPLILSVNQILLILIFYFVCHLFVWWYYKKYGANIILFRLSSWVDILAAVGAVLFDPFIIPSMILLLLIATLGNGIQHGLYVVVDSIIGAFILGISALVIHYRLLGIWPPYNLYFYVLLIVMCVYYSYLLVQRIEKMKLDAIRISEYDNLTGLLSRRSFDAIAEYLLLLNERAPMPLVFIFADLDHFKAVNDQFGHDVGDKVLKQFSSMAQLKFRKSDIISRYGGDEFVLLLTNTFLDSAEFAMKKLQSDFRSWARNNGFPVGVSYGIAMVPEGKNNLADILRQVDAALYEVKPKNSNMR